jgi:hypothetical protein
MIADARKHGRYIQHIRVVAAVATTSVGQESLVP